MKEEKLHFIQELLFQLNHLNIKYFLDNQKDKYLVTTVGKLIFNEILPDSFPYINEPTNENIEVMTPNKYFY